MKKLRIVMWSAITALLLTTTPALAQVSEDGMGKVVPVRDLCLHLQRGQDRSGPERNK